MATEIERKFRMLNDDWKQLVTQETYYCQGYLANSNRASVRIRVAENKAYINIKSASLGIQRTEYEYAISLADGQAMLDQLCTKPLIEKTRYLVVYAGKTWEIDVFYGDNAGLIVAELELNHVDEPFDIPDWVDQEVSDDPRYYNVNLVTHPFKNW